MFTRSLLFGATALLLAGCPERICPPDLTEDECEQFAIQGEVCQSGRVRCADDNTLERCDRGLEWLAEPCGEGFCAERCAADGDCHDACIPIICEPNKTRCDGPRFVQRCSADGTAWEQFDDCGVDTGAYCNGGGCRTTCDTGDKSYFGCEYWAVDLDNAYVTSGGGYYDAAGAQFAVVVSNPDRIATALVRVSTIDETVASALVPPGGINIFQLPRRDVQGTILAPLAFRINSSVPVSAYQFNPLENVEEVFSNDASLLLPTHSLGTAYMVMTREQSFEALRGYFTVVATFEGVTNVTVQISLDAHCMGGEGIEPLGPGDTATFQLEQYDVLSLETDQIGADLTGSYVWSDQPVAVFGGSEAANAPNTNPITCCADHLEEQLFPISSWGQHHLAARSFPRGEEPDLWRILAVENETIVETVPPQGETTKLDAGEWFELQSLEDFEILSDKPVMVGQFLAAQDSPDPNTSGTAEPGDAAIGDPSQIMVVPTRQFRAQYVFLAPNAYELDYVTVVAPLGARVKFDTQEISDALFTRIGESTWGVARFPITDGFHDIDSDVPVGVSVYGYDQYVSYGYPGGLNLTDPESSEE